MRWYGIYEHKADAAELRPPSRRCHVQSRLCRHAAFANELVRKKENIPSASLALLKTRPRRLLLSDNAPTRFNKEGFLLFVLHETSSDRKLEMKRNRSLIQRRTEITQSLASLLFCSCLTRLISLASKSLFFFMMWEVF